MIFIQLLEQDTEKIKEMSHMATEIVREHFDPIIGTAQNDYMISLFQTEDAIRGQLRSGYRYYFVIVEEEIIGFLAFYPRTESMYLSKFYLYKNQRRKGHARRMMDYVAEETRKEGLSAIELNVNRENDACRVYEKLGFYIAREEKNDIGDGFFMDDYVYRLDL